MTDQNDKPAAGGAAGLGRVAFSTAPTPSEYATCYCRAQAAGLAEARLFEAVAASIRALVAMAATGGLDLDRARAVALLAAKAEARP